MKPEILLLASGHRGIYIPQHFASNIDRSNVSNVSAEDWATLAAGPDSEYCCETWADVLDNAVVMDADGNKYTLHQDGDLWAIPVGMEWSESGDCWEWPFDGESSATHNAGH